MRARRAVAAVFLLASGRVALGEIRATEVAAWLTGTFDSKDPAPDGGVVRIVIVSVPKSRIANGAAVLYREQAVASKLDEPSLQRFYRLEEDGEVVRLRAFDPKDPLIVRGKWRDPSALALYGPNDVREKPGCTIALRRVGARWVGGTPEEIQGTPQAACPSNLRNAVRMTSAVILSKDDLLLWDRGFDEKGKQAWGSREGATTFLKRSASAPADDSLQERTGGRRGEDSPSAALTATSPSPLSRKYDLAELRALAGAGRVTLSRLFPSNEISAASVVVVTARTGSVSVFSSAEVSSASSDAPAFDVSSGAIRLVASGGRGLDDIVSIELRILRPAP